VSSEPFAASSAAAADAERTLEHDREPDRIKERESNEKKKKNTISPPFRALGRHLANGFTFFPLGHV
jgi:hypothetical protein